jgi:hypothetical protein
MLNALIDRKYGNISGAGQPAVIQNHLQVSRNGSGAIRGDEYPVNEIRAGQVELGFGNRHTLVLQKGRRIICQGFDNMAKIHFSSS